MLFSFFLPSFFTALLVYFLFGFYHHPFDLTYSHPMWKQHTIQLQAQPRGCHLITHEILKKISSDLAAYDYGLAHFFIQHTSASLTINENYDPDVRKDAEMLFNRIVPESAPYLHNDEGPDDM
ncbi:hypothetical protein HMI56_004748, partial [Coelomomyces lativittatus]